jgi:hypothetical protein
MIRRTAALHLTLDHHGRSETPFLPIVQMPWVLPQFGRLALRESERIRFSREARDVPNRQTCRAVVCQWRGPFWQTTTCLP